MVSAANDVAQTLKGDKNKILSDLLQKLKSQALSKDIPPQDDFQRKA